MASFLPVVERELRVAARNAGSFRIRAVIAIITSCIAAVIILLGGFFPASKTGMTVFAGLVVLAFLFCLFEGTRSSADLLSAEKRDGTLGLLFLTNLKGYDIVLGKFAAVAVKSFQGLLAFFPVLSVALILGGVTAGEFWRAGLVLVNTLFFSLSLGLCISSFSREAHKALLGTLVFLVFITAVPTSIQELLRLAGKPFPVGLISPISTARLFSDARYQWNPAQFWMSLGAVHLLSWIMLAVGAVILPYVWEDRPTGSRLERQLKRRSQNEGLRRRLLDRNPVLWLLNRDGEQKVLVCIFIVTTVLIGLTLLFLAQLNVAVAGPAASTAGFVLALILKLWIASQAALKLAEARRNGALELLLATPLQVDEILKGQRLALFRRFRYPIAAVLFLKGCAGVALLTQLFLSTAPQKIPQIFWIGSASLLDMATLILDAAALSYVATWMAVSQGKPLQAFFKTVLYVLVIPAVLFCIPSAVINFGLIGWARTHLNRRFRNAVTEPFVSSSGTRRRLPPRIHVPRAGVPPVIVE